MELTALTELKNVGLGSDAESGFVISTGLLSKEVLRANDGRVDNNGGNTVSLLQNRRDNRGRIIHGLLDEVVELNTLDLDKIVKLVDLLQSLRLNEESFLVLVVELHGFVGEGNGIRHETTHSSRVRTLDLDLGIDEALVIENGLSHDIIERSLSIDGTEEIGSLVAGSEVLVALEGSQGSKLTLVVLLKSGLRKRKYKESETLTKDSKSENHQSTSGLFYMSIAPHLHQ